MIPLTLHELTPQGKRRVNEWLGGGEEPELGPEHARPIADVTVGDLDLLVREFETGPSGPAFDAAFAPRLHAALPIGRRLGTSPMMWAWLGVTRLRPLLLRRWPERPPLRFVGSLPEHGLARLWWAAELTVVEGADPYLETRRFVRGQYLMDRLLRSRMARNRDILLGILDGLGGTLEWARISRAVAQLGALETTVCLEALTRNEIATCVRELLDDGDG